MPKRRKQMRTEKRRPSAPGDDFAAKKRSRYLEGVKKIDLDDHGFFEKFLTDYGKIMPARLTGATAKQQRQIRRGIQRARIVGLVA